MNDEVLLIMISDEGVLGIGYPQPYGVDAVYFSEGIEFTRQLETDEYLVVGYLTEVFFE
jgi:hypothetical protein